MKRVITNGLVKEVDAIVFRCFAQGQYWGTASGIDDEEGKLNPDYDPDEPIDRSEAVRELIAIIEKVYDYPDPVVVRQK